MSWMTDERRHNCDRDAVLEVDGVVATILQQDLQQCLKEIDALKAERLNARELLEKWDHYAEQMWQFRHKETRAFLDGDGAK